MIHKPKTTQSELTQAPANPLQSEMASARQVMIKKLNFYSPLFSKHLFGSDLNQEIEWARK